MNKLPIDMPGPTEVPLDPNSDVEFEPHTSNVGMLLVVELEPPIKTKGGIVVEYVKANILDVPNG